jgi:hypothetical protein
VFLVFLGHRFVRVFQDYQGFRLNRVLLWFLVNQLRLSVLRYRVTLWCLLHLFFLLRQFLLVDRVVLVHQVFRLSRFLLLFLLIQMFLRFLILQVVRVYHLSLVIL